jgi:uncharacterized protein (DUF58 family)
MTLRAWYPLLMLVLVIALVSSATWLAIFCCGMIAIIAISDYWGTHSLDSVKYIRHFRYRRGFPGEKTTVQIEVQNNKRLPLTHLRTSDPWSTAVAPDDEEAVVSLFSPGKCQLLNIYHLGPHSRILREFPLTFRKRGVYPVGPVQLDASDPTGLFEDWREETSQEHLSVFPQLLSLEAIKLTADDPFGSRQSRRRLFEDPNRPMGVRPYNPTDEFRRIHWNATAATGSLQTKVYQPVTSQIMMVCMNVATTAQPWIDTDLNLLEQIIKITATTVYYGWDEGFSVGLLSNGYMAQSDRAFNIPPGRSPEQLALLLQSLAAVTSYTNAPFETYLMNSMPRISYGALLVIVTSRITQELCECLMRLKKYRAHNILISLADDPPPYLPGIRTIHLPFHLPAEKEKA